MFLANFDVCLMVWSCVFAQLIQVSVEVNCALIVTIKAFYKLKQRLVKKKGAARRKDEHQSKSESVQAINTEWGSCGCPGFLSKSAT